MTAPTNQFQTLLDDELYAESLLASDTRSLWRRLVRSQPVQKVAAGLASDPDRLHLLKRFIEHLLAEVHDASYRHPNDIAICAALVLLRDSPRDEIRNLFHKVRRIREPSLIWVKRIAEFCDERFSSKGSYSLSVPSTEPPRVIWTGASKQQYDVLTPWDSSNIQLGRAMQVA